MTRRFHMLLPAFVVATTMLATVFPLTLSAQTQTGEARSRDETEIQRLQIRWHINRAFDAFTEALAENKPTIVLFSARPCGFCAQMFENMNCPAVARYAGFMEFAHSFRGEDEGGDHLAKAFNVQRYPTMIMLATDPDKLHVVSRIEGVFASQEISDIFQNGWEGAAESRGMTIPKLLSVEETRLLRDQAGLRQPSVEACAKR